MKKFLSAFLSIWLAFSCIAPALAASFPDIDAITAAWAGDAIEYMVSKGVVNGFEDDTFRPAENVTRAQFIKMLDETFGLTATKKHSYSDVADGLWYTPYVEKAVAQGYLLNYGSMLNPDGALSRQEAAALLVRYLDPDTSIKASTTTFTDYSRISANYREYVLLAAGAGIINGFEDDTFRPDRTLTRAEALTILYRAAGTICNDNLVESEAGAGADNAVITKTGITVTGANFEGRVLISEGVTGGTITLSECQIGELIVRGTPSVILSGCTVDSIIVDSAAGHTASISLLAGTTVDTMTLRTPADITTVSRTTLKNLTVEKDAARSSVVGSGTISNAVINASGFTSEKVPATYTLAKGISATFADQVYTTGSTPVAGDTGFTIQPSVYASSSNCYLTLTPAVSGTVYYYFTNSATVPTVALFDSYYDVASVSSNYMVFANRSTDTKIGQTSAVEGYDYIAVMFADTNGTKYQPIVITNMASDGFTTAPTISTTGNYQYLSYTPSESGTVYYYYTNSAASLTVSSFTNTYASNATGYRGELSAVKGQSSSNPIAVAANVSGYNYVAVMLMDSGDNQYQPILVSVKGSASSTSTGFIAAPYANSVSNGVALGFTAAYAGTVEYYFTNSANAPTASQFEIQKSLTQVTLTGSTVVSANTAYYSPLLNTVSTTVYPYIVVRLKSTSGIAYTPVVVHIGGSSSAQGQPGAAGSGFATQPVVSYASGKYTINFRSNASGTLYYYLTNYATVPSVAAFQGNYSAATGVNIAVKTGGTVTATGIAQTAQTVLSTSFGESYDYMVIMLQQGNTTYTPVVVAVPDAEETVIEDTGFLVGPVYNVFQSQEDYYYHQIELSTSVAGTVWYYFTDDPTVPTPSVMKENVLNGGTGIVGADYKKVAKDFSSQKIITVKIPVEFNTTPPAYAVLMLSDNNYNNYSPVVVSTSGMGGSTNITTGFFKAPTVSSTGGVPVLNYQANESGKLYYFFTNISSEMNTMWDFFTDSTARGYFSTSADGVKGVVDIKAGQGSAYLTTTRSTSGYTHVAIMLQSTIGAPGGYRAPIIIALNGSGSGSASTGASGFTGTPYVSGTNVYYTPNSYGTVYYGFTNSNSESDLYAPLYSLSGIAGLGGTVGTANIAGLLATYNNGSSVAITYPGIRQNLVIPSSYFWQYKYVVLWTVTSSGDMTTPVFVSLGNSSGTATAGNGFSISPSYSSWTKQISFTPAASGTVAYFYTNSTVNYSTGTAFLNAYYSENAAQAMYVTAGQACTITVDTSNYKYVWIYLHVGDGNYTPVRVQVG